jgi:hypothetical protein
MSYHVAIHVMDDLWYFLLLSWLEQAGVCYAFVEFEDATAAQSAIEVCILAPFCFP